jgi:hypothetical protein
LAQHHGATAENLEKSAECLGGVKATRELESMRVTIKQRKRASARVMGIVPEVGRIDTAASPSMHCKCDAAPQKAIAATAIGHRAIGHRL